jgi:hypothetical protein
MQPSAMFWQDGTDPSDDRYLVWLKQQQRKSWLAD